MEICNLCLTHTKVVRLRYMQPVHLRPIGQVFQIANVTWSCCTIVNSITCSTTLKLRNQSVWHKWRGGGRYLAEFHLNDFFFRHTLALAYPVLLKRTLQRFLFSIVERSTLLWQTPQCFLILHWRTLYIIVADPEWSVLPGLLFSTTAGQPSLEE